MDMNFDRKNHFKSDISQERMQLIKSRIAEKYYDREDILLEVAKRILKSHDLDDISGDYNLTLH